MLVPPRDEVYRLAEKCPPALGRLVLLLLFTGMRLEEAASLTRRQIDAGRQITIEDTKNGKARTIPLADPWVRQAEGPLEGSLPHLKCPYVFWHASANEAGADRYRNVSSRLAAIKKTLGYKWRIHAIRNRFGVEYLSAAGRGQLYRLQRIMGHSSIKQTEEYLRYVEEQSEPIQQAQQDQNQDHM